MICTLVYLHDGDAEIALFATKSIAVIHAVERIKTETFSIQDKTFKNIIKDAIDASNFQKVIDIWHAYQNLLSDSRMFKFLELEVKNE